MEKDRVLKYLSFAKCLNPYRHVNTLLGNGGMWLWPAVKLYNLHGASLTIFKKKDTKLRYKIRQRITERLGKRRGPKA